MNGPRDIRVARGRDGGWFAIVTATRPGGDHWPYELPEQISIKTTLQDCPGNDANAREAVFREVNAIISLLERFEANPLHDDIEFFMAAYQDTQNWGCLMPLMALEPSECVDYAKELSDCVAEAARVGDNMGMVLGHLFMLLPHEDMVDLVKEIRSELELPDG